MKPIKIAVDAMGGDQAPAAVVKGAVLAVKELGIPLILVGNQDLIARELAGLTYNPRPDCHPALLRRWPGWVNPH